MYFFNLVHALNAEFLTLKHTLMQKLLGLPLKIFYLSQKLVFICPEVIQAGLMLDFHEFDFLLVLKTKMVNFIFK